MFIQKVNEIHAKLSAIVEASRLFDEDIVQRFEGLAELDIMEITQDLAKGNYLGNRKIDVDLSLNNESVETECTYQSLTIVLNNGISHTIEFVVDVEGGGTSIEETASYSSILTKLRDGIEEYNINEANPQKHIVNFEIDVVNETIDTLPTMLRIRDKDGNACNIDRVTLEYHSGGVPVENNPSYYWAKTTSSLEVLANRVGDIIALGEDIDKIIALADKEDEIQKLYDIVDVLQAIHDMLTQIQRVYESSDNIDHIVDVVEAKMDYTKDTLESKMDYTKDTLESKMDYTKDTLESKMDDAILLEGKMDYTKETLKPLMDLMISTIESKMDYTKNTLESKMDYTKNTLESKMDDVIANETNITTASTKAQEIIEIRAELENLDPSVVMLASNEDATVSYDKSTGELRIFMPQGLKGDRGEAFKVDATGTIADRDLYDGASEGFAYLSLDEDPTKVYFKRSDVAGDWTDGVGFGKGDDGLPISEVVFASTTDGSGLAGKAGATDTYNIKLSNDSIVASFDVTNGNIATKEDLGLENVDNTSDANKPVSIATQELIDNIKPNYINANENGFDGNQGYVLKSMNIPNLNADIVGGQDAGDKITINGEDFYTQMLNYYDLQNDIELRDFPVTATIEGNQIVLKHDTLSAEMGSITVTQTGVNLGFYSTIKSEKFDFSSVQIAGGDDAGDKVTLNGVDFSTEGKRYIDITADIDAHADFEASIVDNQIVINSVAGESIVVTQTGVDMGWYSEDTVFNGVKHNDVILCDTSSSALSVALPSNPVVGDKVSFIDVKGSFETNNFTIERNGETIMGLSEDINLDINNSNTEFLYTGSDWRIV